MTARPMISPMLAVTRPKAHRREAFTLIEMMVAVAIMATLLVLFATMISHVSDISKTGQKRLDNDNAGRLALDIIGGDLAGRIVREDMSTLLIERGSTNPNPTLSFLTEAAATLPSGLVVSTPPDTPALVGFKLTNPSTGLERFSQQLTLASLPQVVSASQTNPLGSLMDDFRAADTSQTNSPAQTIAGEVIRMEVEFLNATNGVFMTNPPLLTNPVLCVSSNYSTNSLHTLSSIPIGILPDWRNVQSIVVTLVCVDLATKRLASVSNNLESIASSFPASTGLSTNPVSVAWQSNALSLRRPGLPAASIRIQTRTYPMP